MENKEELSQNRPVLYAGDPNDDSDGHALVCDGYTSNDYFHFNYGWGGVADGFYKLTQVRYVNDCTIFTGVQPVEAVPARPRRTVTLSSPQPLPMMMAPYIR